MTLDELRTDVAFMAQNTPLAPCNEYERAECRVVAALTPLLDGFEAAINKSTEMRQCGPWWRQLEEAAARLAALAGPGKDTEPTPLLPGLITDKTV